MWILELLTGMIFGQDLSETTVMEAPGIFSGLCVVLLFVIAVELLFVICYCSMIAKNTSVLKSKTRIRRDANEPAKPKIEAEQSNILDK